MSGWRVSRFTALVLYLLASTGSAWCQELHRIGPQTLADWMNRPNPPLLLDIRGRAAYLDGTVSGALDAGSDPAGFLPDSRGGDAVLIPAMNQDLKPWYARLADYGYRVNVLNGGIVDWHAGGLPVERPETSFVRPGTVPFVIPRGICELNEPVEVFD